MRSFLVFSVIASSLFTLGCSEELSESSVEADLQALQVTHSGLPASRFDLEVRALAQITHDENACVIDSCKVRAYHRENAIPKGGIYNVVKTISTFELLGTETKEGECVLPEGVSENNTSYWEMTSSKEKVVLANVSRVAADAAIKPATGDCPWL